MPATRTPPPTIVTEQHALHAWLARHNQRRLRPSLPSVSWREDLEREARARECEVEFVERERTSSQLEMAELEPVPRGPDAFVSWFECLREIGPGQGDPLFPWLADSASLDDMRWFMSQEVAGEAGFDDLVALTQIKLPTRPKLEMARNYWDEMGRGRAEGMHGPMLEVLARELGLQGSEPVVWESLALANLMIALAIDNRYAYHAIGALGVIELTAPGRVAQVAAGLTRLGISPPGRCYHELHAALDPKHSWAWNREVIAPLMATDPAIAGAIAEGAWMRLRAGARCFEAYRARLLGQQNER